MTIEVGDRLPPGTLMEYYDTAKDGCAIGPNPVSIEDLTRGKKVVLFGLPGAFTPTCSAKHVPSYLEHYDELKSKGVDTIACLSVNDAFVMGAWGKDQKADGKVMMLGDGNGDFTQAMGLTMDGSKFGLGTRSQRYAMIVDNGVIKDLFVEKPGAFEVSSAENVLKHL